MSARAICGCGWIGGPYKSPARAEAMGAKHVCAAGQKQTVRRATRRYRCARCGLEATYENAGATEARSWFNRHSCQKREYAMLRTAMAEAKEALIDRTPKPCHHKYADHQHGQRATYVLDRCRCLPCAKANSEAETQRERQKAYGRYHKYVNAEHVRAHLAELGAYGIGLKRVSKLSGVSTGTLSKIVFGVYADTGTGGGRNGPGVRVREPNRRVLRSTAERIYAIEAVPENLGLTSLDHDSTPLARQQVRALVALGWSMSELGRRVGMKETSVRNFIGTITSEDRPMQRRTVVRVNALYAELSMRLPREDDQRSRIAASRSRRYAAERGWVPPLELEVLTETVGVVDAVDLDVDEVAVQRRLSGDRSVSLNKAERHELVRRARSAGWSLLDIERKAGVKPERYLNSVAS